MSPFRIQSDQLTERARGLINPLLIRATRPRTYDLRNTLVIAGYPRSGTTWLAEVIANIPESAILFEPLDFRQIPAARRAGLSWDNFHLPDEEWKTGESYLRQVLEGAVLTSWTTSHIPVPRAARISRWIVKFVRANQMLGWIIDHFEIPPPVLIVRHPCAVFSSWVSRGWPLATHPLPTSLRFFSYYPQHREWVTRLNAPEEIFAARWAMHHLAAFDQLRSRPHYLCIYERMVTEGFEEVSRVLRHWNLTIPASIGQALRQPSAKASSSLTNDHVSQVSAWTRKVSGETVERMLRVLDGFGLDFYGREAHPDYCKLEALTCAHRELRPCQN